MIAGICVCIIVILIAGTVSSIQYAEYIDMEPEAATGEGEKKLITI